MFGFKKKTESNVDEEKLQYQIAALLQAKEQMSIKLAKDLQEWIDTENSIVDIILKAYDGNKDNASEFVTRMSKTKEFRLLGETGSVARDKLLQLIHEIIIDEIERKMKAVLRERK